MSTTENTQQSAEINVSTDVNISNVLIEENASSIQTESDKIIQNTLEKINSRRASVDDMPETQILNEDQVSCTEIPTSEKANQFLSNIKTGGSVLRKSMISSTEKLSDQMATSTKTFTKEIKSGSKGLKKATISGTKETLAKTKSLTNTIVRQTQKKFDKSKAAISQARFINDGVTRIPLKKFIPESVKASMGKDAVLSVKARRELVEDSGRNGERTSFIQIVETCQLPVYLIDNDMLGQVESKLINGFLVVTYPLDPSVECEEVDGVNIGPIVIPIEMVQD